MNVAGESVNKIQQCLGEKDQLLRVENLHLILQQLIPNSHCSLSCRRAMAAALPSKVENSEFTKLFSYYRKRTGKAQSKLIC